MLVRNPAITKSFAKFLGFSFIAMGIIYAQVGNCLAAYPNLELNNLYGRYALSAFCFLAYLITVFLGLKMIRFENIKANVNLLKAAIIIYLYCAYGVLIVPPSIYFGFFLQIWLLALVSRDLKKEED